jgi:hypothetical protein
MLDFSCDDMFSLISIVLSQSLQGEVVALSCATRENHFFGHGTD